MNDFGSFLDRFAEVRDEGQGNFAVPCPAHTDEHPSLILAVKQEDGRLVMYCRAGCETPDVLDQLGMRSRDLFHWTVPAGIAAKAGGTSTPEVGPSEIAALRHYVDATGADFYRADTAWADQAASYVWERFGLDLEQAVDLGLGVDTGGAHPMAYVPPRFARFPRLTVPLWGFDGVPRGLQGRDLSGQCRARWLSLSNPEGLTWARYGVFRGGGSYGVHVITEGPSDALTVAAVGYDAVAVRGAGIAANAALAAEIAEGVRGSHVVIAGDRDKAGEGFTSKLGDALREHGITAHHLVVPVDGGDVTDWRERDPDTFADAFHEAVRAARPVTPTKAIQAEETAREMDRATGTDMVTREDGDHAAKLLGDFESRFVMSDTLRAHALVAFADGRIKYAEGLGYYVWNGRVWEQSETKVRQEVHRMGAALALSGKTDEAKGFLNTSRIKALMEELRAVPSVYVDASSFDDRPELLSVRNGTVDLRTGMLRGHDMADMITRYVNVDYRPNAEAPRWEKFLHEIFPNRPELVNYVQRLIGYGITGSTAEQCFAVLWGKGANGKSVLMDTLTDIFEPVSRTTPFATFEEKPNGGIPNDLAALRGARLVRASEGEQGKPMAEAVLKRATGSDKMSARFLRKEFFEFKPTFLLLMDTNHKPKFKGQDEGIWRRVKMLPFERWFAPHEREHGLERKLKRESEGILAWAIAGAVAWYKDGLQDPDVIRDATREYKETSDTLSGFYPGVIVPSDENDRVLGKDAFNAYLEWCEEENLPQKERWSRRFFYSAMEERGVYRKRTVPGIALFGVRIAGPNDPVMSEEDISETVPAYTAPSPTAPKSSTDIFGQQR